MTMVTLEKVKTCKKINFPLKIHLGHKIKFSAGKLFGLFNITPKISWNYWFYSIFMKEDTKEIEIIEKKKFAGQE